MQLKGNSSFSAQMAVQVSRCRLKATHKVQTCPYFVLGARFGMWRRKRSAMLAVRTTGQAWLLDVMQMKPSDPTAYTYDRGKCWTNAQRALLLCREMDPEHAETDPFLDMLLRSPLGGHTRERLLDIMLQRGISSVLGTQFAEQVHY